MAKGKIITFYSYKGGTGRSMALANIAWILASNGKRVLVIDWDLEAPGLHRYFQPFLIDPDLLSTEGLIDYAWKLALGALTPPSSGGPSEKEWMEEAADLSRYAVGLDWEFESGQLDFIPAGKQGPGYSDRATTFDWLNFYQRMGGGKILEAARERMQREYDFVLIDSRTGVSDTSGICTIQMPDVLVACFTPNLQSIEGVAAVLDSVAAQRPQKELRILPVMMRLELGEKEKLETARTIARKTFQRYLASPTEEHRAYWGDAEVLYHPFYAYGEILATFGDKAGSTGSDTSLLSSMERLAQRITSSRDLTMPSMEEARRIRVLASYPYSRRQLGKAEEALKDPSLLRVFESVRDQYERWSRSGRKASLLLTYDSLAKLDVSTALANLLESDRGLAEYVAASRRAGYYWTRLVKEVLLPLLLVWVVLITSDQFLDFTRLGISANSKDGIYGGLLLASVILILARFRRLTGVTLDEILRIAVGRFIRSFKSD